ncbi:hypothetical protein DW322_06430 [Rhodococcus rhodnii]|uniref:Uncharacterized protein n=2 Tax=Rhodococcus rhodnii TaxID=38312 RepID=R7WSL8_9NOCA|nr:hypothetical protein [Rhodococcus rhodnii]EOM77009.1 hypothetical protein Rrhod_1628 [Rhodococcus rhodnii LMG 5362]TXG89915.1 hypothetical protein DW322_06430 [Rhodococcus rhodnii]
MTTPGWWRRLAALWSWALRRSFRPAAGAVALPGAAGSMAVPAAFAAATAVEVAVLHLVVPWLWLSVLLAGVSLWSVALLLGHVALDAVHPHTIDDAALTLRRHGEVVAEIAVCSLAGVVRRRSLSAETGIDGGTLTLAGTDGTNVEITLTEPVSARIPPAFSAPGARMPIDRVLLWLDDAPGAVETIRRAVTRAGAGRATISHPAPPAMDQSFGPPAT